MKNRFPWSFQKTYLSLCIIHLYSPIQAYFMKISLNYFLQSSLRRYSCCASRNLKIGQLKLRSWPMHFEIQFSILYRTWKNSKVASLDSEMLKVLGRYKIWRFWKPDCIATGCRELTCQVQVSSLFFNTSPLTSIHTSMTSIHTSTLFLKCKFWSEIPFSYWLFYQCRFNCKC